MPQGPPRIRHAGYTRARLAQTGARLMALTYADRRAPDELSVSPRTGRISHLQAQQLAYRPAAVGARFGPLWATYWFRLAARVPEEWAGARVDLLWRTGTESTLWIAGRPRQGLSTGEGYDRPDAVLLDPAEGGERAEAEIELVCNGHFGAPYGAPALAEPAFLEQCELARFDPEAWELAHDFRVLQELEADAANGLDPSWAGELATQLSRFCDVWVEEDRSSWAPARALLAELLGRRNAARVHELGAIGHGHLDTAWLWPLAETWRKIQRTFTTQLELMRRYPEHRFAVSAAQHLAWVKERDPDLFGQLRAAVDRGQMVPVGGTWIEPDCNLPSGESLVRQLLHGQRFFERELGRRCTELWNPDVFGYTNQLPQLLRGAGMRRFLTQKLSWNRFTSPPSHSFTWEGLDGSRVLTHFPPADTYNATVAVAEVRRGAAAYKDHDRSGHSLLVFGHGDGGGGPTAAMLETLRRTADLQGVPRTRLSTSEEFFGLLEAEADDLPVVVGELYFEYHRGTYTSQAQTKRDNRRAEAALHDAEFLAAAAARAGTFAYPSGELERFWRGLLLNQFHDILPGSSIGEVYAESARQLADVIEGGFGIAARAARALVPAGPEPVPVPVNTIGAARAEVAQAPGGALVWAQAPSYGWGAVGRAPDAVELRDEPDGGFTLENGRLTARLAADGTLRFLVLRATGREALSGAGNVFELYDDRPVDFDAWDIDPFHLDTRRVAPGAHAAHVVRADALRAEVRFEHAVGTGSTLNQVVRLDAGAGRLEFHTEVDWHERHTLLKVAFPLAVRAARATYEVAFGHAERPTHFSTAADAARYEVPGHRWADLGEHGFGVALLNDGKYGHSAHGDVLRLSLLRAPTHPDPEADQGVHRFAYALVPHAGDWRDAGIVAEAARFNHPLRWTSGTGGERSLAAVDHPALVLDTVKRAEDSGALVLRLYEACGGRGTARVTLDPPPARARRANLLEDPGAPLELQGGAILVPYGPYEVITVLVE